MSQGVSCASGGAFESADGACGFASDAAGATDAADVTGVVGAGKNSSMMYSTHYKSMYLLEEIIDNLQMR